MREKMNNPFEKSLRLLLDLHVLIEAGKGDGDEADNIRDLMDESYGKMSQAESDLIAIVSETLYGDM
jgi:hypothetical protein